MTLEESVVTGGFGSAVLEVLEEARLADPRATATSRCGSSGSPATGSWTTARWPTCARLLRLDAAGIAAQVRETLATLGLTRRPAGRATPRGVREA